MQYRPYWLAFGALAMLGADLPGWKTKPVAQWNDEDALQILSDSPWTKSVKLDYVRDLSENERRDSGNWEAGTSHGVGLAGLAGILGGQREAAAVAKAHAKPDPGSVFVRWESALPVHAAEIKTGETGFADWKGPFYAISVNDITPPFHFNLANQLKGVAFLHRDKKSDLKPKRVQIIQHDNGLVTVVYLFSRSAEITKKDMNVRFQAQIGRLFISQFFFPSEMEFAGNLEF